MRKRLRGPVEAADDLIGREVSCGVFTSLFRAVEREEIDAASLVEGTGFSLEHFRDPTQRVSWPALQLLAERLATRWTDDELRLIGSSSLETDHFEPQIFLARLLLRPTEAYAFVIRGDTQGDFACLTARTTVVDQHVTIDVRIAPGYGHSPAFFSILAGAAEAVPTLFGLAPASVDMVLDDRGARFEIEVPAGGGRWSWVERVRHRVWRSRWIDQVDERLGQRTVALETEVAKRLTMEVQLKARLDEHKRRLASLNDVVIETSRDGSVTFASPSLEAVLQIPESDFMADPWAILQPPNDDVSQSWLACVEATSRWIEVNPSRYSDDPDALLLVVRDVTDRVELQAQLSSKRRLESLGVMAAGVAHDFNNLLVPIRANAGSLAAEVEADSAEHERLVAIEQAADMASNLVDQILATTGHSAKPDDVCDLAQAVRAMGPVLGGLMPSGVSLELDCGTTTPAQIDRESVDQLVTNLVLNAAQAIVDRGTVTVSVTTDERGPLLTVLDDGIGMPPELAERITEPFFTTKSQGRGLGLAPLAGLITSEAVEVDVDSTVGVGTAISVSFRPAAVSAVADSLPADPNRWSPAESALLLIDDDKLVRDTMQLVLRPHFGSVVSVSSADEALALLEGGTHVDVVVSDLTMPGVRGPTLIRRIRALRPELPCLLVTGAGTEAARTELIEAGVGSVGIVAKPFTPPEMLEAIAAEVQRCVPA